MQHFVDETIIEVSSGAGGDGRVSFRREKYVPKGGPDGGDGGKGGDVVFVVQENLKTLAHIKYKRTYHAENGQNGQPKKMHGRNGDDAEIPVPPGSVIFDAETGELLKDLTGIEDRWVFLTGGNGGFGNQHFATSTRQAPKFALPGKPGEVRKLRVELKLIADIGFVGFPNAGKSTLLSVLTNAHPKIGSYPFTTKIPNLGVMYAGYRDIILADIPGIIEGASHGAGLGFRFLRHISRSFGLAFLIDLSGPDFMTALETLEKELETFEPALLRKNRIVIGTKMDAEGASDNLLQLQARYPDEKIIGISSFSREGIEVLKEKFLKMVETVHADEDEEGYTEEGE